MAIGVLDRRVHKPESGVLGWLLTTDHKQIGIMYLATTVAFFVIGGIMALIMRTQLAWSDQSVVSRDTYNQIFTMHGTTMLFLFIIPVGAGFANYVLPLMLGAKDMAYPRINALSLWLIPLAGLLMYSGFLVEGGSAAVGWTGYPPLSAPVFSPGKGVDLWAAGLLILGIASVGGSINFLVTAMTMRAPGMTLAR